MQSIAQRAVATRRVYHWEAQVKLSPWLEQDRPIAALRVMANWVFDHEGHPPYRVVAHRGVLWGGQRLSFCYSTGVIYLARNQRTFKILLHEIAHALGHWDHLEDFVRCYLGLLVQYGREDPCQLLQHADEYRLLPQHSA